MTILFENMFYNANVKSGFQNITNVSIAEINFRLTKMIDNKIFFESLDNNLDNLDLDNND